MRAERAIVVENRALGGSYFFLRVRTETPHVVTPGQFAMLRGDWGDEPLLPRPMSYLEGGAEPAFLMKVVGRGTARFRTAAVGESISVHGPLGNAFSPPTSGRALVLVAGGVGIVPLHFYAKEGHARDARFLYGGRTAEDLPLADEIARWSRLEIATEDGSRGHRGRVTELLDLDGGLDATTDVLCCGPTAMMRVVAENAHAAGARCFASLEAPMGCGYGVCLGCVVREKGGGFRYVCTDGPVVDAATLDWPVAR